VRVARIANTDGMGRQKASAQPPSTSSHTGSARTVCRADVSVRTCACLVLADQVGVEVMWARRLRDWQRKRYDVQVQLYCLPLPYNASPSRERVSRRQVSHVLVISPIVVEGDQVSDLGLETWHGQRSQALTAKRVMT
jgi:hypothetical protein